MIADRTFQDAEFPGIVARPIGNFAGSKAEYHYQTLRCNVDLLKPIQLGITVWTTEGELPPQQPEPSLISQLNGKTPYGNNLMHVTCTMCSRTYPDNLRD
jgi:CCR4-NOT transcription complex subunit 7/8